MLKKKLKRKAEETEKKLSSKKCKLLQDYEEKKVKPSKPVKKHQDSYMKEEGTQTNEKTVKKNNNQNTDEGSPLNSSKPKKKKKQKVPAGGIEKSQAKTSVKKESKKTKAKNFHSEKSEEHSQNRTVDDQAHKSQEAVKEKKRQKRLQKKAARLKQKERQKAQAEGGEGESGVGKEQALEYLHKWKTQRQQWNFQKVRQVWLLQHMYNSKLVSWDALSYFYSIKLISIGSS